MKKNMIEILACPIDKKFPLDLIEFYNKGDEIEAGILICKHCSRFYPIIEEIPVMLPDELRDKKNDIKFLEDNEKKIPINLLKNLKPWSL